MSDQTEPKYLYNPNNGMVRPYNKAKHERFPFLMGCNELDGSDAPVHYVEVGAPKMQVKEETKKEGEIIVDSAGGIERLAQVVLACEDKKELRRIAADLGAKVRPAMKVATMQGRIIEHLEDAYGYVPQADSVDEE